MLISDHHARVTEDKAAIRAQAEEDLAKCDSVILMGNDYDIDPKDYGETYRHPKTHSEQDSPEGRIRAAYEYTLVENTLAQKKPLFAVCGGMQRLNVFLNGTVHQHVPDLIGTNYHHQGEIAPFIPVQYVAVAPGTKLASIAQETGGIFTPQHANLPAGVFMENSFHHQAVDRVGDGLIPCAFSIEPDHPDLHIVQAIEADPQGPYSDQFVLGVQWHPEFGASDLSMRTLQNVNEQAVQYARSHPRTVRPEELHVAAASSFKGAKTLFLAETDPSIDWNKIMKSAKPKGGRGR